MTTKGKHRYRFMYKSAGWYWFEHFHPGGRTAVIVIRPIEFWGRPI